MEKDIYKWSQKEIDKSKLKVEAKIEVKTYQEGDFGKYIISYSNDRVDVQDSDYLLVSNVKTVDEDLKNGYMKDILQAIVEKLCGYEEGYSLYGSIYKTKVLEEIQQWYTLSPKYRTKEKLLKMIEKLEF
jgi:hypothetical protein